MESTDGWPAPDIQGTERINRSAARALWKRGLWTAAWRSRLEQAPQGLVDFINQFYRVPGFELAAADYFGHRLQKGASVLAVKLSRRIAERSPGALEQLAFERSLGLATHNTPYLTILASLNNRHYHLLPYTELDPRVIRRKLAQAQALYEDPAGLRWVFDGRRLGMSPQEVVSALQESLSQMEAQNGSGAWVESLPRMVMVL